MKTMSIFLQCPKWSEYVPLSVADLFPMVILGVEAVSTAYILELRMGAFEPPLSSINTLLEVFES